MKKDALLYFDIITSLKTVEEVASFTSEIDTFLLEKTLDSISTDSAKKIKSAFAKGNLDLSDQEEAINFFTTLKELLKKLKIITLILAFCPSYKMLVGIHNFIKKTIGIGYILDIEILDEVLGGAIIIFNGKYLDFTLKKDLDEAFKNKNTEIQKLMT